MENKKISEIADVFCKLSIFDKEKREFEKKELEIKQLCVDKMDKSTLLSKMVTKTVVTLQRNWEDKIARKVTIKKVEIHYTVTDFVKECRYPNFLLLLVLYVNNGELYKFCITKFNEEGDRYMRCNVIPETYILNCGTTDGFRLQFIKETSFIKVRDFCHQAIESIDNFQFQKIEKIEGL